MSFFCKKKDINIKINTESFAQDMNYVYPGKWKHQDV